MWLNIQQNHILVYTSIVADVVSWRLSALFYLGTKGTLTGRRRMSSAVCGRSRSSSSVKRVHLWLISSLFLEWADRTLLCLCLISHCSDRMTRSSLSYSQTLVQPEWDLSAIRISFILLVRFVMIDKTILVEDESCRWNKSFKFSEIKLYFVFDLFEVNTSFFSQTVIQLLVDSWLFPSLLSWYVLHKLKRTLNGLHSLNFLYVAGSCVARICPIRP